MISFPLQITLVFWMQKVRINCNNKLGVLYIAKYFQIQNQHLFDITDEHIVLCSNNLEPAIMNKLCLQQKTGHII